MVDLIVPRSRSRSSNGHGWENVALIQESRIQELELVLQDQSWSRIGSDGGKEFGRSTIGKIADLARVNYLKNPIINRAIEVSALYVWGQDLSYNTLNKDVKKVIDDFWKANKRILTGQQASRTLEVELETTGNLFFALFTDDITGEVQVRTIPLEEIKDIICNPEDRYEPWFYRREWDETPLDGGPDVHRIAYYPCWQIYDREDRPPTIADNPVRWNIPVVHLKVGAFPHWRWGVSEVYPALDWAQAYKRLLEDDVTRSRALARFVWRLTTEGGKEGVAAARQKLATTFGLDTDENNPPPAAGSTFIAGKGNSIDPLRISGAALPTDHSRPARLMASAGSGVPDHFYDADVGNFATSKTLDRPTELRFSERRQMWIEFFTDLSQWVIERSIESPAGILKANLSEDDKYVKFSWPDLLERSVVDRVEAIVAAATLRGRQRADTIADETVSRMLLTALGEADIDGELKKLEKQIAEKPEPPPVPISGLPGSPQNPDGVVGPTGARQPTTSGEYTKSTRSTAGG